MKEESYTCHTGELTSQSIKLSQLQINEDCSTRIKHSNKKTNSSLGYHIIYNLQHMVPNNLVSTN